MKQSGLFFIMLVISVYFFAGEQVFAASVCDSKGRAAEDLVVSQSDVVFTLIRRRPDGRLVKEYADRVEGVFNASAGLRVSDDGSRVVAPYKKSNEEHGIALWLSKGQLVTVDGMLTDASFSNGSDALLMISYVPNPNEANAVELEVIYSAAGGRIAERSISWNPEDYSGLRFSERGDVVYRRFGPGMSTDREIVLYDSRSFSVVAKINVDADIISDLMVIDRDKFFFTSGGAVFGYRDGHISVIGDADDGMRHERLDFDARRGRLLSYGAGGYKVFSLEGESLSKKVHGRGYQNVIGFAGDGNIMVNAVDRKHNRQVLHVGTGAVLSELRDSSADPRGQKVDCASVDGVVIRNDLDDGKGGREIKFNKVK